MGVVPSLRSAALYRLAAAAVVVSSFPPADFIFFFYRRVSARDRRK